MDWNRTGRLKRIFDLYTSDLSYDEIERLIKQDASDVYEFFKKEIPQPDKDMNKVRRGFIFIKSLFNAFLLKLNPARRFFYFVSILFLFVGLSPNMSGYLFISFGIINLLLAFELADKLLVKNEIEVAQKIQLEMVPKAPPQIPGYQIAFHYEPAKEVGGDYLDFTSTPDKDNNYIVIGDVSGKGIAAALYVVRVQAIIHQLFLDFTTLKQLVADLKKYFSFNLRKEFFLTLAILQIKKDNTISVCRAGHNAPFYFNSSNRTVEELRPQGLAIGFNDNTMFNKILEETTLTPGENDIIFLYTDGVSETMNERRILFGEERIKNIISANASKSSEEIKKILLYSLNSFKGKAPIADDLAFVILKKKENNQ